MLVVADTSPLNYLIWIELSDILPKLYQYVVIPPEVINELLSPDAPASVRRWAQDPPAWVQIRSTENDVLDDFQLNSLDAGERAAIILAMQLQPQALLIDERAGSKIARNLGLRVTGTLGVLDAAAQNRLISFHQAIERLKQTTFRYPQEVVAKLLTQHAPHL